MGRRRGVAAAAGACVFVAWLCAATAQPINVGLTAAAGREELTVRTIWSVWSHAAENTRSRLRFTVVHDRATDVLRIRRQLRFGNKLVLFNSALLPKPAAREGVDPSRLDILPQFWRFFLPDILASSAKVLYLDPDSLVVADIAALYDSALTTSSKVIAAGAQRGACSVARLINTQDDRLRGVPLHDAPCLTAGAFVVNITAWREQKVGEALWGWVAANTDKKLFPPGRSLPLLTLATGNDWDPLPDDVIFDTAGEPCCRGLPQQTVIAHPVKVVEEAGGTPALMPPPYPADDKVLCEEAQQRARASGTLNFTGPDIDASVDTFSAHPLKFVFCGYYKGRTGSLRIPLTFARNLREAFGQHVTLSDSCARRFDAHVVVLQGCKWAVKARAMNPSAIIGMTKPVAVSCLSAVDFVLADTRHQMKSYWLQGIPGVHVRLVEDFGEVVTNTLPPPSFSPARPAKLCYHGGYEHFFPLAEVAKIVAERAKVPVHMFALLPPAGWVPEAEKTFPMNATFKIFDVNTFAADLADCDLGLVPQQRLINETVACTQSDCSEADITLRIKSTANGGRAFVFMQLGVPVITETVPESSEDIGRYVLGEVLQTNNPVEWAATILDFLASSCLQRFYATRTLRFSKFFLTGRVEAFSLLSFLHSTFPAALRR